MNEIDIRIWDKKDQEMYYDVLTELGENEMCSDDMSCWSVAYALQKANTKRVVGMLYTGHKDKHGKKLYKGDIVKSRTLDEKLWGHDFSNYEIGTNYGSFCFIRDGRPVRQWKDGTHDWYSIENIESFEIEVIGNVYENPELLEK